TWQSSSFGSSENARREIFPKMANGAHHGIGCKSPERAERTEFHRIAKVFEERHIFRGLHPGEHMIDDLDTTDRADPARCAFAATFDRAKLHREPRHLCHIDR